MFNGKKIKELETRVAELQTKVEALVKKVNEYVRKTDKQTEEIDKLYLLFEQMVAANAQQETKEKTKTTAAPKYRPKKKNGKKSTEAAE